MTDHAAGGTSRGPAAEAGTAATDSGDQRGRAVNEPDLVVVRRSGHRWRVGDEETEDLTSAMVLADLLAPGLRHPASPGPADERRPGLADDAARLRVTVTQLEHALVSRVRVEQAIGIVAERRRVPPKEAFGMLRSSARATGTRIAELAALVVDSTTNPLLALPEELARPPRQPRERGKSPRHVRGTE